LSFFAALDRLDSSAMAACCDESVELVDEISRRWLRGRFEVEAYLRQTIAAMEQVESRLDDLHCSLLGETALITAWLEQTYTFEGKRQQISSPTTVVLRCLDGQWKLVLFHSLPLAESA
jgi:ketosteroid isomerase-like protein